MRATDRSARVIDMRTVASDRSPAVDAPPAAADRPSAPAPPNHPRARWVRLLLQGHGWAALRLAFDASLLLLAIGAARLGAPAAQIASDGEALVWLFPPLVLAIFGLRRMYSGELQVQVIDGLGIVVAATSLAAATLIAPRAQTLRSRTARARRRPVRARRSRPTRRGGAPARDVPARS